MQVTYNTYKQVLAQTLDNNAWLQDYAICTATCWSKRISLINRIRQVARKKFLATFFLKQFELILNDTILNLLTIFENFKYAGIV